RRRQTVISELLRTDHKRSTEITELRTALQGQVTTLQGQVTALQVQVTALQGQQRLAGGPAQPELPEEAARDALRSTNGDDRHNFGTGVRRTELATRECLPDMIHGSVVASKPKTMQEAIEIATELMDEKIRTFAERETRGTGLGQKPACYECGVQGHFKRECPKLKNNNNHGNQGGRNNAPARVYVVDRAGIDLDVNVVTGTFLLNN
nr:hypothetical protein [Tanacetum cinerariifolium]